MTDPEHNEATADLSMTTRAPDLRGSGARIGPYRLQQALGEGGFGIVFHAVQEAPVRRDVAIKVIKLGMDTKQVIARFEAERQALAVMDHPHIAKAFDAGATEAGRPYFVMELCRGEPITAYCDKNHVSIPNRLHLFVQVCDAVQHAHTKGIIHRDLKPSNVLVSTQDGQSHAKVIDFGIAKAALSKLTDNTIVTQVHQLIGTPEYMSPEQAEGSLNIDTRTDVYSLGVILYELLTGTTPFQSQGLRLAGYGEIQRFIREVEPPRPSTRLGSMVSGKTRESDDTSLEVIARRRGASPRELSRAIERDLDWIVMKSIEKDPTRRYPSASELAADIRRHLAGEPVSAAPPSTAYRLSKFVRRHRLAVMAGSVAAAGLLLATMVATGGMLMAVKARENQEILRKQAEASEQRAKSEAQRSGQVASFLKQMLSGVDASVALGRDTTLLRELLDSAAERVDVELADQPEVRADLNVTMANVYLGLSQFEKAERTAQKGLDALRAASIAHHPTTARALNQVAMARAYLGRPEEAEPRFREALALRERLFPGDNHEHAEALANMGFVLHSSAMALMQRRGTWAAFVRRCSESEHFARKAVAMYERLDPRGSEALAKTLNNLAWLRFHVGDRKDGLRCMRESLNMYERLHPDADHPEKAFARLNLANMLADLGQWEESVQLCREALEMFRRLHPHEHVGTGSAAAQLAYSLHRAGDYANAEPLYRDALAIFRRLLPSDHEQPGTATAQLGWCLSDWAWTERHSKGPGAYVRAVEAEATLRGILAITDRVLPPDDWRTASAGSLLGGAIVAVEASRPPDIHPGSAAMRARLEEAESLMLHGYNEMKAAASGSGVPTWPVRLKDAAERLVRLYTLWDERSLDRDVRESLATWQALMIEHEKTRAASEIGSGT